MTFRAGLLRHWITIRRAAQVQNAKGGYDTAWSVVARCKARVEGLDGREAMVAHALQGISAFRITLRWRSGIKPADQIDLGDGTRLNIASLSDPDGKRERLVILADSGSTRKDT